MSSSVKKRHTQFVFQGGDNSSKYLFYSYNKLTILNYKHIVEIPNSKVISQ